MSFIAETAGDLRPRRSVLRSPEVAKIALGVGLILLTLYGQQLYGMATSAWRLDPALRNATGPRNVIVVLDFQPERFHSERIQQYGAFAGRDGSLNRIRLRNVRPARLRELAAIRWVARIEPMK
jgi:hypothetical protein